MICMLITVSHEESGWFVTCHDKTGPYLSKERAVSRAEGIAAAMRRFGTPAEVAFAA